ASGFLSGKYKRDGSKGRGDGRLETLQNSANPVFNKFTERNWRVLDALADVAQKMGRPVAQVALNWVGTQPGITSIIVGATKLAQLDDSFASLDFTILSELRKSLTDSSAIDLLHPYMFFEGVIHERVLGGTRIEKWRPGRVREASAAKEKASAAEK
ncbi:MAG: aldo/keto reductase, partial [Candidatus Acidiferrales bacterium]